MRLLEMLHSLENLPVKVFTTSDAAVHLKTTNEHGSQILRRLSKSHRVIKLKRGLWALTGRLTQEEIPQYLTAPLPCYLSLQTALYHHGMIDQIPSVVYAVSLARTQIVKTDLGTLSIHHINPPFFFGYKEEPHSGLKIAIPEKALVDILYLGPARSKLFSHLPEIEIPASFSVQEAYAIAEKIPSLKRRHFVIKRLKEIL